jgi:hypothetical protein
MPYYRWNPSGLTVEIVLDRLKVFADHCRAWGVVVQGVKMTSTVVWVQTNIAIPPVTTPTKTAELGFDATQSSTEPTVA